jgi:hypothetical protein
MHNLKNGTMLVSLGDKNAQSKSWFNVCGSAHKAA